MCRVSRTMMWIETGVRAGKKELFVFLVRILRKNQGCPPWHASYIGLLVLMKPW